jgi:alkanesulfonate monooxygenase SsuD/methylene tetrahydromethanopterin reductase-like flavin-dependent oxidoreductase (luciferase family)
MEAIKVYRERFQPSAQLAEPYVMLGFNVFAADSDEEGRLLATSLQQAFVNLRSGNPTPLQPPVPGYGESLPLEARALLRGALSASAIGSPQTVRASIRAFVERTGADELMITSQVYDHGARLRSFEIAAEVMGQAAEILHR